MEESPLLLGKIFNIQRFSTHDGPGVRTTVFMKGCPLRCFWCQNPESQKNEPSLFHNADDCIGCGSCVKICSAGAVKLVDGKAEVDRYLCTGCGDCVEACPVDAFSLAGKDMTVSEVLAEVLKDRMQYINSGGGITLSGGDPLVQYKFSAALLEACKKKALHTVVETCGYADNAVVREVAPYTDLFFYDIKTLDNEKHINGTGTGNARILENAAWLARAGNSITLRMPVIPGYNDNEGDVKALLAFAKDLGLCASDVKLLKYNKLGETKFERLGRKHEMKTYDSGQQYEEYFDHLTSLLQ